MYSCICIHTYITQFRIHSHICKYIYIHLFICGWGAHAMAHMSKSEDNVQKLVLSFHHVDSRPQTQVTRLGGKCVYLTKYLTGPYHHFKFTTAKNSLLSPSLFNSTGVEPWIHPCFAIQSITSIPPWVPHEPVFSWPFLPSLS